MFEQIKSKNPGIPFFRVTDEEFRKYGNVLDLDTRAIVEASKKVDKPENGVSYTASIKELENFAIFNRLQDNIYGQLPIQIGYCVGKNSKLNALEWHAGSEVNIAVTPMVLFLAHRYEVKDMIIDSSKIKAFYMDEGQIVEINSPGMHYCPCQVENGGFCSIVVLPAGTNLPLEKSTENRLLCAKNKWLIAHMTNEAKLRMGAFPGITGENYEIKY